MFSAQRIILAGLLGPAALSCSIPAFAGDGSTSASAAVAVMSHPSFVTLARLPAVPASPVGRTLPFGSRPLGAAALATRRGGDRVFNDAQLKGVVSDNQAVNVNTGGNVISDGAFAGSAGLSTVIQNTGNNVLIQNSTIVNVQLK